MRKVVFDIETKNIFQDVGSNNPADLSISVVGVYDSETDLFSSYLEEELPRLWPILETAEILIGFNSEHFDIPLLNKYYPGNLEKIKGLDILKEIQKSAGRRMKLSQLAEGTLGVGKSGSGLEAILWWKNGEIEKIRKYCLDDVRITRDLYNYALKNNKLIFKEGGRMNEIKLDTSEWEMPAADSVMNRTLPF
jgi:DEAD/DEAH box helicase domain-containing protein